MLNQALIDAFNAGLYYAIAIGSFVFFFGVIMVLLGALFGVIKAIDRYIYLLRR